MTKEECKDLLVKKIDSLGGIKADELVAWRELYTTDGFPQVFHPDMIRQLLQENRISGIEYFIGEHSRLLLVPKDTKVKLINTKITDI